MHLFRLVGVAVLVASASGSVFAVEDKILTRKKLMTSNGAAAGAGVAMIKQETPFSPAVAAAVFRTMNAVAFSYGDYFPEGSQAGDTAASPKIWEDRAGFEAELAKFQQSTDAAVKANPDNLDAFKAAFSTVAQSCNSCHEAYRIEK